MRGIPILLVASCCGSAQSVGPSLIFDVASVKIVGATETSAGAKKSEVGPVQATANPVRFSRRNATLASLLLTAYGLIRPQQLIGPDWLTSERYEIDARSPEGTTPEQQSVMLQNLLAERFRVRVHRESREMPVYELVVAKRGPKLSASDPGAKNPLMPFQQGGPLLLSRAKDGVSTVRLRERGTMEGLATRLSREVDRPIVDRTGLKGEYDVVLRWPVTVSEPGNDIFAAFESQLGLKLEPKKGALEVLVVDHAEKVPTPN